MYMWIPQCMQAFTHLFAWILKPLFGSNILLASRNLIRYKRRSALSVGALMLAVTVGMAGMIVVKVIDEGQTRMINFNYPQDIILRAVDVTRGFSPDLANQVRKLKGVEVESFTNSSVMERDFSIRNLSSIQIKITSGDPQKILQTLQGLLQNPLYQNVQLINKMKEKQAAQEPTVLFSIVLAATIFIIAGIATLGLMNHAASSIRQRIRELATLRAIGMTKFQMVRLIFTEGMMTSIFGGTLGILSGGIFAYLVLLSITRTSGVSFPFSWIYGTILVSPVLGLLASWSAGAWASKQDILKALSQY